MRENRTPGSTSGDWKRDYGSRTEARSESDGMATGPYSWRASPRLYLTEDFQFSSEPEFGLEAVDIVTNTIRRSLSGHFNRAGWLAIPQLMIHRASHCIKLISLSREDQSSRPVPYANVMNDFRHGGRAMFPQGYFDE